MKAIKFNEANIELKKPSSMTDEECSSLWIYRTNDGQCNIPLENIFLGAIKVFISWQFMARNIEWKYSTSCLGRYDKISI
jgi:hypothetical protein